MQKHMLSCYQDSYHVSGSGICQMETSLARCKGRKLKGRNIHIWRYTKTEQSFLRPFKEMTGYLILECICHHVATFDRKTWG